MEGRRVEMLSLRLGALFLAAAISTTAAADPFSPARLCNQVCEYVNGRVRLQCAGLQGRSYRRCRSGKIRSCIRITQRSPRLERLFAALDYCLCPATIFDEDPAQCF